MNNLPVQMHPRYAEFLAFMTECPHRKTPSTLETAFWAWLKVEESLEMPFLANKNKSDGQKFTLGSLVRKKSGSEWQGHIVGWYSTTLTIEGYAVESEIHKGSVQIYPASALELVVQDDKP